MEDKNIVITGGAGFIGSNLAKRLVELGNNVTIIDDFSTGNPRNLKGVHANVIKDNICDYSMLLDWFCEADVVYHLAAISGVQKSIDNPFESNTTNVSGTLAVLEAAKNSGIDRVVFSSSAAIYGEQPSHPIAEWQVPNPVSPYALTKLIGEEYCRLYNKLYGLDTKILRYFNVFGERQDGKSDYAAVVPKFITAMMKGERPVVWGDGEQTRDFTYVRNVVEANILAGDTRIKQTEAYNIASGSSISVNDLLYKLNDLLGTNIKPIYVPARAGEIRCSSANINKAKRRLGYFPKVLMETGLDNTIEYCRQKDSEKT